MNEYLLKSEFVTVITTGQGHIVLMPNGVRLPAITKVVTIDEWGDIPKVEVTMQCNLAHTGVELDAEKTPMELAYKEKIKRLDEKNDSLIKENLQLAFKLKQLQSNWWYNLFS